MSKIWDALRRAERDRAGLASKDRVKHIPERRRSERRPVRLPVLVYGHIPEGGPFHESSQTICVNDDGGLLSMAAGVARGQSLLLTNELTKAEQVCRVVLVRPEDVKEPSRFEVAVEFTQRSPGFWSRRR